MKLFCLFLLFIKINLLSEKYKYPINNYFDIKKNNDSFYSGNQLVFLKFNNSDNSIFINSKKIDIKFDINNESLFFGNNTNQTINICNETEDFCILEYRIVYGEIIFVRYIKLSYYLLFFGFFVILYGYNHYIFGLIIHFSIFVYFIIKDLVELFSTFSYEKIPLFLFFASLLSGISIAFFFNISDLEKNTKNKILKILYGSFFGFFLFKAIFYHIIAFSPLNKIIYIIFLFIFIFLGLIFGYLVEYLPFLDKYFFIPCSILPGSFYIIKGLSYMVGGYYSEILTIKEKLEYNNNNNELERDGNFKEKIALYICIQIFLIIASVFYQIFYIKYLYIDDTPVQEKNLSSNASSRESLLTNDVSNDISRIGTKTMNISKDIPDNSIDNNSDSNNSGNIEDVSNDIYDQED